MLEIDKIYLGDCLEVMKDIEDKSVSMVLTDPPFGIGRDKQAYKDSGTKCRTELARKNNYIKSDWDNETPTQDYFDNIIRISKNQIIFGCNYFIKKLPDNFGRIFWNKKGDGRFSNDFADGELVYSSFNKPLKTYNFLWSGMIQQNMKNKEIRYHPTQKPVKLIEKMLLDWTEENDLICDPYAGSGSILVACINTNRRYIGIEKEQEYFDIAQRRIEDAKTQPKLFY